MDKYIEHKIGEVFDISDTVKLKTVEDINNDCQKCYYKGPYDDSCYSFGFRTCSSEHRSDGKSVKFIKV